MSIFVVKQLILAKDSARRVMRRVAQVVTPLKVLARDTEETDGSFIVSDPLLPSGISAELLNASFNTIPVVLPSSTPSVLLGESPSSSSTSNNFFDLPFIEDRCGLDSVCETCAALCKAISPNKNVLDMI